MSDTLDAVKASLLDQLLDEALTPVRTGKMVAYIAGVLDITEIFGEEAEHIYNILEPLSHDAICELFRPHLARAICRALEAKNVTIEW